MSSFPSLALSEWRDTRDTLTFYCQVVGKVRRALMPRQRHWWHVSLRTYGRGLTTTPILSGDIVFDVNLDLVAHAVEVETSDGRAWQMPLGAHSPKSFCTKLLSALEELGITAEIDRSQFSDEEIGAYDQAAVERYWTALSQIDQVLKEYKGQFREETSPVQLWPHHMDHAVVWFSGRLVPDQDLEDEEYADEQINAGFSTGDEGIPDAYFYVTAYPTPDGWAEAELPSEAHWQTEGYTGAILPYAKLTESDKPRKLLLDYLNAAQSAGAVLMK